MSKILVTGSNNGLGKEIFLALGAAGHHVIGYDVLNGYDVRQPNINTAQLVKLSRFAISNLTHQDSIHDDGVYSAMIESILIEASE